MPRTMACDIARAYAHGNGCQQNTEQEEIFIIERIETIFSWMNATRGKNMLCYACWRVSYASCHPCYAILTPFPEGDCLRSWNNTMQKYLFYEKWKSYVVWGNDNTVEHITYYGSEFLLLNCFVLNLYCLLCWLILTCVIIPKDIIYACAMHRREYMSNEMAKDENVYYIWRESFTIWRKVLL